MNNECPKINHYYNCTGTFKITELKPVEQAENSVSLEKLALLHFSSFYSCQFFIFCCRFRMRQFESAMHPFSNSIRFM